MRTISGPTLPLLLALASIALLVVGLDAGADEFGPATLQSARKVKDDSGNLVAAWSTYDFRDKSGADADIMVARSSDDGATWTTPVPLNTNAATDSGVDLFPHVATDKAGHWVALWESNDTLGGTTGSNRKILAARSTDNGATWTAPAPLHPDPAPDACLNGAPKIATDRAGHWVAVWHCYGSKDAKTGDDADIFVARSIDNGATWTPPAPLNADAATDTAEDVHPRLEVDDAGIWVTTWMASEMNDEDSLGRPAQSPAETRVARSRDNGVTWAESRSTVR